MVAKTITPKNEDAQDAPKKRTTGNKVFDLLVYPTIAFGAVFAFSVWMLHTTKYGSGFWRQQYDGWVDKTIKGFRKIPFLKEQPHKTLQKKAENYISVLVSFAAGTLLIAPIKIFEDYRGKISHKIDEFLGSVPKDKSAYDQEPKQSWSSVLGGRALTFAAVLGLATVAGKHINHAAEKTAEKIGNQWGKWHPSTPAQLKNVQEWSFVSVFEGFYTALCAALLYVFSRKLARSINKKEEASHPHIEPTETPIEKSVSHTAREVERKHTATQTLTSLAF